jgi:hypothetical protein
VVEAIPPRLETGTQLDVLALVDGDQESRRPVGGIARRGRVAEKVDEERLRAADVADAESDVRDAEDARTLGRFR